MTNIELLENRLDDFNLSIRQESLKELWSLAQAGKVEFSPPRKAVNLHFHSFFSYNACGYSPSKIAWLSRKAGLAYAGIVDFDVLDGLEEFYAACELIGLKGVVGLETRVFVPEFAEYEINSPGEPGISYHMGIAFGKSVFQPEENQFLESMKNTAQQRNRALTERVSRYLQPVELDYDSDVLPLSPKGNPTERHICAAYARKAAAIMKDKSRLAGYWSEKLGLQIVEADLPESAKLTNAIRTKTMKQGGVGYVKPDAGEFPTMTKVNRWVLACGGIPVFTWLNGLSAGERQIEKLLDVSQQSGAAAVNIIPDRNYTPGVKDEKIAALQQFVEIAKRRNLPIIVGTEMNSPGQKFVDSFETAELSPLIDLFIDGAKRIYQHAMKQRT